MGNLDGRHDADDEQETGDSKRESKNVAKRRPMRLLHDDGCMAVSCVWRRLEDSESMHVWILARNEDMDETYKVFTRNATHSIPQDE